MRTTNEDVREPERRERDQSSRPRDGVLTRVRAVAHNIGERVRKALGRDDDTRPPGFNGAMLVA